MQQCSKFWERGNFSRHVNSSTKAMNICNITWKETGSGMQEGVLKGTLTQLHSAILDALKGDAHVIRKAIFDLHKAVLQQLKTLDSSEGTPTEDQLAFLTDCTWPRNTSQMLSGFCNLSTVVLLKLVVSESLTLCSLAQVVGHFADGAREKAWSKNAGNTEMRVRCELLALQWFNKASKVTVEVLDLPEALEAHPQLREVKDSITSMEQSVREELNKASNNTKPKYEAQLLLSLVDADSEDRLAFWPAELSQCDCFGQGVQTSRARILGDCHWVGTDERLPSRDDETAMPLPRRPCPARPHQISQGLVPAQVCKLDGDERYRVRNKTKPTSTAMYALNCMLCSPSSHHSSARTVNCLTKISV